MKGTIAFSLWTVLSKYFVAAHPEELLGDGGTNMNIVINVAFQVPSIHHLHWNIHLFCFLAMVGCQWVHWLGQAGEVIVVESH